MGHGKEGSGHDGEGATDAFLSGQTFL